MIKFFRKIRQKLLSENKFSKYLLYAIGEIILVVIGILIALQINTWNNNKEAKLYEKKILSEIKIALQRDLDMFKRLKRRIDLKDRAIDTLLLVRKNKLILSEKHTINYIDKASIGILFSYDKGAYETVKSVGLEKIKTDSLRNRLIRFYEVFLPRTEQFMDNIGKYYEPIFNQIDEDLKKINFYEDYFTPKDSTSFIVRTRYNVSKIHSASFHNLLITQAKIKDEHLGRISAPIKEIAEVLEMVNKELNTRFKE